MESIAELRFVLLGALIVSSHRTAFSYVSLMPADPNVLPNIMSAAWSGMLGALLLETPGDALCPAAHRSAQALVRAAHLQGAQVFFVFPTQVDAAAESSYIHLCQELAVHCIQLSYPACPNSVIVCSTDGSIRNLPDQENPWQALQCLAESHCSNSLDSPLPLERLGRFMPSFFLPKRPAVCDGAGLHSTADHTANNLSTKAKPLQKLASQMLAYLSQHGLVKHIEQ